jgi:hypothetical protein
MTFFSRLKALASEALGLENHSDDWRVNPNLPVPPEPDPGETANDPMGLQAAIDGVWIRTISTALKKAA